MSVVSEPHRLPDSERSVQGESVVEEGEGDQVAFVAKEEGRVHAIAETVLLMLVFQAGLYACVFEQIATTQYKSMFWVSLAVASSLGMIQIIYFFVFRHHAVGSPRVHIVSVFVSPIVQFVATAVLALGLLELALDSVDGATLTVVVERTDEDTALFIARAVLFGVLVLTCWYLFVTHLDCMAMAFGGTLFEFCLPTNVLDDPDDPDASTFPSASNLDSVSMVDAQIDPRPSPALPTPTRAQHAVLFLVVCQTAFVGTLVPIGLQGIFAPAFLPMFGLACVVLAVVLAYLLLLRSVREYNTSMLRIWCPLPITVLIVNSWVFLFSAVEYELMGEGVAAFADVFEAATTTRWFVVGVMLVCYAMVVVLGTGTTRAHLRVLALVTPMPAHAIPK